MLILNRGHNAKIAGEKKGNLASILLELKLMLSMKKII